MQRSRYLVGIDLGTTNCAVAYVDSRGRERPSADIRIFEVPQLVAPGEAAPRPMLPSFLYLPGAHELPTEATRLPWSDHATRVVGEFARVQGARVPSRLVASAKSWLCHAGVDREAEILPWGAPEGVPRVSPVEASAEYLKHIRDAWNHQFAAKDSAARLEEQEVVLTVPASFDEAARELTVTAARQAGLNRLTLLEEPQAAFYCWIVTHQEGWQSQVRSGELILVCDIGGGTTDFSLITVVETPTGPGFRRVAVGDHLMLGGDNVDLALAHIVEAKLGGGRLDSEQWSALRYAARTAKERMLSEGVIQDRWPVTIPGRGSKVVGGSLSSELTRDEVTRVAVEGFMPFCRRGEEPARSSKLGLQEFGLPFVTDPAITRHLAAFLRRHRAEAILPEGFAPDDLPARPDAILFNGGALTPKVLRDRLVDVVASWFVDEPQASSRPRVLSNESLDLAVAIGAAYYGVVRRGGGIRIGGGTARSYYVGFESAAAPERPWLCVVPRDAQEGDEIAIEDHDFELLMGRPVAFPLASSSIRPNDRPGDLVASDPDSIRELPPLIGTMRVGRKAKAERVPVQITTRVTEVGTVELWCRSRTDERRWRLQIQLRGASGPGPRISTRIAGPDSDHVVLEQSDIDTASAQIRTAFETADPHSESGPAKLVKHLEAALEIPRPEWPPSALRAFWEPLREVAELRTRTPRHEARWLNLAGYCLRPGVGFPLDETRIKALWPVFHEGVKSIKDQQCWAEWWILWRRVSAGLNRTHHEEVFRRLQPFVTPAKGGSGKKASRPKPEEHEMAEIWRCAASLERLQPSVKETLGDTLLRELRRPSPPGYILWCLGRLGARTLLYGPANTVVSPEVVRRWLTAILPREPVGGRERSDLIFALAQMGRVAGDRALDLDEPTRELILDRLQDLGAEPTVLLPVREYQERSETETGVALGDALPAGLRLRVESADLSS